MIKTNDSNLLRVLNLTLPAQKVTTGPPIGLILGQFGIKIKDFCNKFNDLTNKYPMGSLIRTDVLIYKDLKYDIILKTYPINFLLFISIDNNNIFLKDIYKIIYYYLLNNYKILKKDLYKSFLKNIIHYLNKCNIQIICN